MASAVDAALVDMQNSLLNDTIWRALKKAGVQFTKEPTGLLQSDGKGPDGVTLIPWARGRCLTWDVTVPDTFATSHIVSTSYLPGAAAEQSATVVEVWRFWLIMKKLCSFKKQVIMLYGIYSIKNYHYSIINSIITLRLKLLKLVHGSYI